MSNIYDSNNIFYKIINKQIPAEIVIENKYSLAFKDVNPRAPVHILVIPKGQYHDFDSFLNFSSKEEMSCFFQTITEVIKKYELNNDGYRIISNNGENGRQEVPHFHMHILGGSKL